MDLRKTAAYDVLEENGTVLFKMSALELQCDKVLRSTFKSHHIPVVYQQHPVKNIPVAYVSRDAVEQLASELSESGWTSARETSASLFACLRAFDGAPTESVAVAAPIEQQTIAEVIQAEAVDTVKDVPVLDDETEESLPILEDGMPAIDVQFFDHPQFGQIRTAEIAGEPWMVGKDVATALGYSNASKAVGMHVDPEDKQFIKVNITDAQNGNLPLGQTKTAMINESGMYALVLSSKLSSARQFKRWVTSEVLPSIRKHDAYVSPETLDKMIASPEFGIRLLTALQEERNKNAELSATVQSLRVRNGVLTETLSVYDARHTIAALMRRLGNSNRYKSIQHAWNAYYKTLRYSDAHICLTNRNGSGALLDRVQEDEWPTMVAVALAMCERCNIDVSDMADFLQPCAGA
jgi:prophage antirepressor-like protein